MLKNRRALISGASVAGPALAYWLGRYGFSPTVVETAPKLRSGGYAVDFRGEAHLTVLQRMGLLDRLRQLATGGAAMRFVDEQEATLLLLPKEFAGGELDVLRSDLTAALVEHSADRAEYRFGDRITSLTDTGSDVEVGFASGLGERFDLVIGADGVHSGVRRLIMGPEDPFVTHQGFYVAAWDLPNTFGVGRDSVMFNRPGRMVSISADPRNMSRANTFCVFAAEALSYDRRDPGQQQAIVHSHLAGMGWKVPELLDQLGSASDLYFDAISRVDVPQWSSGRVALLGDAAHGATLGGMGTGAAIVGAYLLAGELALSDRDPTVAFTRYETAMRGYATRCQKGGDTAGKFFAPRTRLGITARNKFFGTGMGMKMLLGAGSDRSERIDLPNYPSPAGHQHAANEDCQD